MKFLLILTVILSLFYDLKAQDNNINTSSINCLKQTKEAFNARIHYFLYKNDSLFEDSYNKLIKSDSVIKNLNIEDLSKSNKELFELLSSCITKEISFTKNDIDKLSVGYKAATKTDYGEFQMTEKGMTYFTFLTLIIYKINNGLK